MSPSQMPKPETVSITLKFRIDDAKKLVALSDDAIELHGAGVEINPNAPMASRVVELLLHSNPGVNSYLDYGIELLDETLVDEFS